MGLSISRDNPSCAHDATGCVHTLASGDVFVDVASPDMIVARDLTWAAVHATIPFRDDLTRRTFDVRVDLVLVAYGQFNRSDSSANFGYVGAHATGVVQSDTTTFVPDGVVSREGMISRAAML